MIEYDGRDILFRPPTYPSKVVKIELGGRWDKEHEYWKLPPTSLNVLRLLELYGDEVLNGAPDEIRDLAEQPWGFRRFSDEELAAAEAHPSWAQLYDFQREGVEYLVANPHDAGLGALSWGLGKAATSIVAADLIGAQRVLVLAPLTLAPAWIDEWRRWSRRETGGDAVLRATAGDRAPGPEVTIANHEVIQEVVLRDEDGTLLAGEDWIRNAREVKQWIAEGPTRVNERGKKEPARQRIVRVRRDYLEAGWDVVIADESVVLKNRRALKADVLLNLRRAADTRVWMMSASPTTKFRNDLFKQMQILFPRAFASYWRFTEFFCVVDKGGWGWTVEGDRPQRDPQHYLRDLLWVKSEDDADVDLPEYIESSPIVEPKDQQRKALDQMLNEWIVELDDADVPVVAPNWLARTTRLQQITSNLAALPKPDGGFHKASSAKEDLLLELVLNGDLPTPLLVWCWFVETTRHVRARLERETALDVVSVDGSMSSKKKDAALAAFKSGTTDVLVCQIATGKFGHTFTDTRSIFYHDRCFDSDAYIQSRRRVRRLGLKHRPTLIVPKVPQSADELIDLNLEGKLRSVAELTNANLADLLRSLR